MSEVKLFKKKGTYVDKKDGKEKSYTNFYVRCGDDLIPVQVSFFENAEGRDPQYAPRRAVLSAFAETLPEKVQKAENTKKDSNPAKPPLQPIDEDDGNIPF